MNYVGDGLLINATISYESDFTQWAFETGAAKHTMSDVLRQHFGPPCNHHDDNCPNCKRWKAFHELFANPYED